jgi:hypothetical protein
VKRESVALGKPTGFDALRPKGERPVHFPPASRTVFGIATWTRHVPGEPADAGPQPTADFHLRVCNLSGTPVVATIEVRESEDHWSETQEPALLQGEDPSIVDAAYLHERVRLRLDLDPSNPDVAHVRIQTVGPVWRTDRPGASEPEQP